MRYSGKLCEMFFNEKAGCARAAVRASTDCPGRENRCHRKSDNFTARVLSLISNPRIT